MAPMQQSKPQREPLLIGKVETARLLGVSVRTLEKMIRSGEIPARRLRRRVLIPASFVTRLASEEEFS
jgi:excisionase family DNA binding protein